MRRSLLPIALLAGAVAASHATTALAQSERIEIRTDRSGNVECFRNSRRVDCESLRADRSDRARERSLQQARAARERALQQAREARERALDRAAAARRRADEERRRQNDWAESLRRDLARDLLPDRVRRSRSRYYDTRPRLSLGGGADIRRFDDVNRYLAHGGVDFHAASGLGMRPEVVFGWTDRQRENLPVVVCPACSALPITSQQTVELRSRSKMLGVNLDATYTMLRGSIVRPYLLGGVGVLSTREVTPVIATTTSLSSLPGATGLTYRTESHDRVDLGLNAGAGLEFGRGPVRLFTEFRYFLNDTPSARGFSGMLPITAGLRF